MSSSTHVRAAVVKTRRVVQKGMRKDTKARRSSSGSGQELLEQRQGARVVGLAQPKDRLAAQLRIGVAPGNANEGRHAFVVRPLGEREDGGLLHVPIHVALTDEVGQPA